MILLTVGTQLPFNRLVAALDELAISQALEVYGQIGVTDYKPKNFPSVESIAAQDFDSMFRSAHLIVAHAGIGTVLTAQKYKKPIVLFPRQAKFGEHRNDHQAATCRQLEGRPGIYIAWDEPTLAELISRRAELESANDLDLQASRGAFASQLRDYLGQF